MDRNTALGAAAGVTLAVVGAVSALFLTIDQPADAASPSGETIEYVDQYGNPLAAPEATSASPGVVLVNPDGTLVDTAASADAGAAYGGEEYEEHGEEEEYDEHGEEMEHAEGEHEEYGEHGEEAEEYDEEEEDYEDEDDDYEDGDEDEYEEDEDDD